MPKFKLSPFLKDILLTSITSVVVIVSMIFVIRFLAKGLGPDEFGVYSLARRFVSFVLPFSTLSLGVGLTRYIAISRSEDKGIDYLVSGMLIVSCVSLVLLAVGYLGGRGMTLLLFQNPRYITLYYFSLFMIVGYGFFTILYSYYRGIQRMDLANIWQVCIMAIFPLAISYAFAREKNVAFIVALMGLCFFAAIFPLVYYCAKFKNKKNNFLVSPTKDLLKYCVPRTPGGLALAGLFAMGPFLAPYFGSIKDAGYLAIGLSVFRIAESSVVAFGLVVLPKASQIVSEGRTEFLRSRISDLLTMIIHIGLFVTVQLFIWSEEIVLFWLGNEYLECVPIIRVFLVALCPYLGFAMLRSIINAIEERAINVLNIFVALGIAVAASLFLGFTHLSILGIALGTSAGIVSLGGLTIYFLVRRYQISFDKSDLVRIICINSILAGITALIRKCFMIYFNDGLLITMTFMYVAILFVFYIWFLYKNGAQWFQELQKRVLLANT